MPVVVSGLSEIIVVSIVNQRRIPCILRGKRQLIRLTFYPPPTRVRGHGCVPVINPSTPQQHTEARAHSANQPGRGHGRTTQPGSSPPQAWSQRASQHSERRDSQASSVQAHPRHGLRASQHSERRGRRAPAVHCNAAQSQWQAALTIMPCHTKSTSPSDCIRVHQRWQEVVGPGKGSRWDPWGGSGVK